MTVLVRGAAASAPVAAPSLATKNRSYFRPDIEGLRALAVTVVVAFHASVPHTSGGFVGVDIFFVISGYLISGLLLREIESTGRISFANFYARRARRILPAATIVLVAVSIAALTLDPLLGIFNTSRDLLSAALYMTNWHFIDLGTDYLAGSTADSPVLHYWSLAVEEQFYLVWPLVLLGAVALARRFPLTGTRVIAGSVGLVTVASLVLSLVQTQTDPKLAYMATTTRAWEFGVGALVATVGYALQRLGDRRAFAATGWMLGWAGVAAIVYSVLVFDEETPFPGTAALIPTLGTTAIIAGGLLVPTARTSIGALLSLRPIRYLGRLSFGWYLWHWPVLILVEQEVGHQLSWRVRGLLMLAALLLAAGTLHLIEVPIGKWKQVSKQVAPALALGLLCMVVSSGIALAGGSSAVNALSSVGSSSSVSSASLASVFGGDATENSGAVSPNPLKAKYDTPKPESCLLDHEKGRVLGCEFGPATGTPVVLFGDSHAEQWLPAIRTMAKERGWHVSVFSKSGCPVPNLTPRNDGGRFSQPECITWRAASIDMIVNTIKPKLIFVSSLHTYVPDTGEMLTAWNDSLDKLRTLGSPIVNIRDTPHPLTDVPTCISAAFDDWSRCAFARDSVEEPLVAQTLAGNEDHVTVVDMLPYFCDGGTCPAVRNGLLLYRDDSHITATAARVLAPALEQMLVKDKILTKQD